MDISFLAHVDVEMMALVAEIADVEAQQKALIPRIFTLRHQLVTLKAYRRTLCVVETQTPITQEAP